MSESWAQAQQLLSLLAITCSLSILGFSILVPSHSMYCVPINIPWLLVHWVLHTSVGHHQSTSIRLNLVKSSFSNHSYSFRHLTWIVWVGKNVSTRAARIFGSLSNRFLIRVVERSENINIKLLKEKTLNSFLRNLLLFFTFVQISECWCSIIQ